ncbi:uncharacterized protein KY384_008108 [Bacidia gigantensis]|uniref:uncharacterized protein n=1 Tax=Bacidia gigantensis TaxID=2732470 RepID=UPI001D03F144|nr:uncharacterized protein KY384_008108 [Bacidia gigantensis]KAG8526679.1 hypothetical protein KY384_008108 [Bacidia gigantensis]
MKGVTVEKPGAPFVVVDDLEIPEPGDDQILVKSIATAIDPVEGYMQGTGLLITAWPIVLGCDASGVVVKAGTAAASKFKPGDRVCGCTRLGIPGYCTFQEYFLMDTNLVIPTPKSFSFNEAAALGVGAETACLGLLHGIKLEQNPTPKDIWVVVFGGAGSIGQYSIQIVKALGYKVVATCSKRTADLVTSTGADAVIDYSLSEDEQIAELKKITEGKFFGVWDSVAKTEKVGRRALQEVSSYKEGKVYATTDDWTPMENYDDHTTFRVELGLIGRSEEEMKAARLLGDSPTLNEDIAGDIKLIHDLAEKGQLKPNPLQVIKGGFEAIAGAFELQQKGTKGGEKVIVEIQPE